MKIAVSFLGIKENLPEQIQKLNITDVDYFHFDIMDGQFVDNTTRDFAHDQKLAKIMQKSFDIHLMVNDVRGYIKKYSKLKPEYITFHVEIDDVQSLINYAKKKKVKVGLAIKPETFIDEIIPYLNQIDIVLVMTVEPGKVGQKFLEAMAMRIDYLAKYRETHRLSYLIQVDGGINPNNLLKIKQADIGVVGSYITNSENYETQIKELKKSIKGEEDEENSRW